MAEVMGGGGFRSPGVTKCMACLETGCPFGRIAENATWLNGPPQPSEPG
jgi:hypothetical protein